MDVLECIVTRRSVRDYLEVPVEWDKVGSILEAGKWAPSAGNLQSWKFILVQDADKRAEIAEICQSQHWMAKAPLHIVVVADAKKAEQHYGKRGATLYAIQDCAAAIQNMILAAHSLGLGTCWVSTFDDKKLAAVVACPPGSKPQAVIPVGYPAKVEGPPSKTPLEVSANFEKYGSRIKDMDHVMGYHGVKVHKLLKEGKNLVDSLADKFKKSITKNK